MQAFEWKLDYKGAKNSKNPVDFKSNSMAL